jgi:hypothetical protein
MSKQIENRLADLMYRHATVEATDPATGQTHRGVIVSIVVPARGVKYQPDGDYKFALDVDGDRAKRISLPFASSVTEVTVAEINTTDGPTFNYSDPDYSVNHVS